MNRVLEWLTEDRAFQIAAVLWIAGVALWWFA